MAMKEKPTKRSPAKPGKIPANQNSLRELMNLQFRPKKKESMKSVILSIFNSQNHFPLVRPIPTDSRSHFVLRLLPCLGRNYTSFSEALRRDLESFYSLANKKPSRLPDLETYIKANYPEK